MTQAELINKYTERIMVDYPESDKIHIDLMQFAEELRQCNVSCSLRALNNKVDFAYFCGVFNVSGIDGLQKEIDRLKAIGKEPHDFLGISNDS